MTAQIIRLHGRPVATKTAANLGTGPEPIPDAPMIEWAEPEEFPPLLPLAAMVVGCAGATLAMVIIALLPDPVGWAMLGGW